MFTLLVIAAGIVTAYILLHLMVLKLPKCKSNVQLHGKVVIVTGKVPACSVSFALTAYHALHLSD